MKIEITEIVHGYCVHTPNGFQIIQPKSPIRTRTQRVEIKDLFIYYGYPQAWRNATKAERHQILADLFAKAKEDNGFVNWFRKHYQDDRPWAH